jgi:transcription antitermination factor NusG
MNAPAAESPWFALVVRSRWEKLAATSLQSKGYECLLPVCKERRRWSDRWKELELPLFPGYLFCRFQICQRAAVLSIPGILSVVGFGRMPSPVDSYEIAAVQLVAQTGFAAKPWSYMHEGEVVRLDRGPLQGLTGIVLQCRSDSKLILSVTLLKRSIAVEIDREWVSKVPAPAETTLGRLPGQPDVSMVSCRPELPTRPLQVNTPSAA